MTITGTGNIDIDGLLSDESWLSSTGGTPTLITYSFMTSNVEGVSGFQAMNSSQQSAAAAALASWASVANIQFKQVATGGQLQFGTAELGSETNGKTDPNYGSNGVFTTNYIYLNNTDNSLTFTPGSYGPSLLLAETGQALGLTPTPQLNSDGNNRDHTVMSPYDGIATTYYSNDFLGKTYSVSPMLLDIQAIQYLYGANTTINSGDTVYSFSNTSAPQCIWDPGGNNSFDFSACTQPIIINLNPGSFSSTDLSVAYHPSMNISIAYNTQIQTAIAGSGGSTIYCNSNHDTIIGGAGDDTIYLGSGTVSFDGKGGNNVVMLTQGSSLAGDSFTNVQTLNVGLYQATPSLTIAEYSQFPSFQNVDIGIIFADAGTIVANPTVSEYLLADGSNIFKVTGPASFGAAVSYLYSVAGATTGSDLYDVRGSNLGTETLDGQTGGFSQLVIQGRGGQDTLELSGSADGYIFVAPYGGGLDIHDLVAGRDGWITTSDVQTFQFTDMDISADDPLMNFIGTQNTQRLTTIAPFHFGIAGATTDNVVGEESANLGSGYNAVVLSGAKSNYGVSVDSSGTLTLTDDTTHQTYTITGDHYLVFDNGATTGGLFLAAYQEIDFILQGTDAEIAALYNAALGRQPDLPGLEFYGKPIAEGTLSLHQAAVYFINSPEFQTLYPAAAQPADDGGRNDQAFISSLYQNILHRTPSAGELSFYVSDLQGTLPGVPQQDRAQLLIYFALSAENQKAISGWLI